MRTRHSRTSVVLAFGLLTGLVAGLPGTAHAGGPGHWTKLSTIDNPSDTVGMLRTNDGKLHLVWLNKQAADHTHSFGTATLTIAGGIASTGTAVTKWDTLEPDPQLVANGPGLRLLFEGSTSGLGTCFATGLVYTATSPTGSSWTLANNTSLSAHSAGIGNLAATVEADGTTPVAAFAAGQFFHEGTDTCPASNADGTVTMTASSVPSNPAIVTDNKNPHGVYLAWYQSNKKPGYWVEQLLPTQGAPMEAPGSEDAAPKQNNQPLQPVGLVARGGSGGGVYMAYCVASSAKSCTHIDLWKVGSSTPMVVPGSSTGSVRHVALAAGNAGRLTVLWVDTVQNKLHAVRTNTSATAFGVGRTIAPPPNTSTIESVQAEGTFGRLDVLVNDLANDLSLGIWQTQILAGLSLTASPSKFSNTAAHTVTFTVKDAGQAVGGAKVSCMGLSTTDTTNSSGQATLTFPKGFSTGKHVCTAGASDYNPGKATLTVTH